MTHHIISHLNSIEKKKGITHRLRTNLSIRSIKLPLLRPRNINHAIDDRVHDMNPLWSELSRQRLRQGTHRELAGRETGEEWAAAHGCCGGGED